MPSAICRHTRSQSSQSFQFGAAAAQRSCCGNKVAHGMPDFYASLNFVWLNVATAKVSPLFVKLATGHVRDEHRNNECTQKEPLNRVNSPLRLIESGAELSAGPRGVWAMLTLILKVQKVTSALCTYLSWYLHNINLFSNLRLHFILCMQTECFYFLIQVNIKCCQ